MSLKYHKIFTHDPLNAREISEVYTSDSHEHGRLFIILETPKNKTNQQPYIDEIINQAATAFEVTVQEDPELTLEEILQKLNKVLPELSAASKIRNWLASLDLVVGIIFDDSIFLASIGNINGLLIHSNKVNTILSRNTDINPTKIFSDIVSGQLDEGDGLVVSTNALFDYISQEKIKQIVKRYAPSAAAIKLNELLETVPDFVTFNALIIKKPGGAEIEIRPEDISKIDQEKIEAGIIDMPNKGASSLAPTRTKLVVDTNVIKNARPVRKAINIFSLAWLFFKLVGQFFVFVFKKVKNGILFLFSARFRKQKEKETLDEIKVITEKKYSWWRNLSLKKKIALGLMFVIALVFIQSLVFLTQNKYQVKTNEAYDQALVDINAKYQEVDAQLIYNNEAAAEKLLVEIEQTVNSLTAKSPEQQQQIDQMKDEVFHKLNKVRHIYVVPSPVELFDLSTASLTNALRIVQKDQTFYILDTAAIYSLTNNKLEKTIDFSGGNILTDWPGKNRLIIGKNDEYSILNLDNKQLTAWQFTKTAGNTSVKDMTIYANNLYVLDPANKQIFKYSESGDAFSNGTAWLKDTDDISSASSFTIDSSVYIIQNDGQIKQFIKGQKQNFDYTRPNPAIGANATIKTFKDSEYLYIIDPANKRIVILDKKGNIKNQYTSQKFDKLTDLAVDPQEKAIYLLNGLHLYLLAIN